MATTTLQGRAAAVAECCTQYLPLAGARLHEAYFYQSLPFCVIDAVYSINARYEGVEAVVTRYCAFYGLQRLREPRDRMPPTSEQQPLSALIEKMSELGSDQFAREVFQNGQRTSTRSGILKSEAVLRFATVLQHHGINFLQDVEPRATDTALERDLREIPGQKSGISTSYFFMLAGSEKLIKPDRRILSFLERCVGQCPTPSEAQVLLSEACGILKSKHPQLTPRLLDYVIWDEERKRT